MKISVFLMRGQCLGTVLCQSSIKIAAATLKGADFQIISESKVLNTNDPW